MLYNLYVYYFTVDRTIETEVSIVDYFGTKTETARACELILRAANVIKIDMVNSFTGEVVNSFSKQGC